MDASPPRATGERRRGERRYTGGHEAMKLLFLGTRGYVEARTRRHRRHTALEVAYRGRRVMVDCGADWRGELARLRPPAIVLTHAHPDHAFGLEDGAPCPVWATADAWAEIGHYPIAARRLVRPRRSFTVEGIGFEAFPVEHSIRAPAVGYRITAGRVAIFYAPDLVFIHQREAALRGCRAYVGDGATVSGSFVRRRGQRLIGHAPVATQLGWCAKEGVPRAIFTHCGTQILTGDERAIARRLLAMAAERGVAAAIARDGLAVVLR